MGLPDPFVPQKNPAEAGQSLPWLAPSLTLWDAGSARCWQDRDAGAHPGVTTARTCWERRWVGQPGAAELGAFPACRSRALLAWQHQCGESCSGRGLAGSASASPGQGSAGVASSWGPGIHSLAQGQARAPSCPTLP